MRYRYGLCVLLFALGMVVHAQDVAEPPVIRAQTFERLQSVQRVDFADLEGDFISGRFALDDGGARFAIVDAQRRTHILSAEATLHIINPPDEGDTLAFPGNPAYDAYYDSFVQIYTRGGTDLIWRDGAWLSFEGREGQDDQVLWLDARDIYRHLTGTARVLRHVWSEDDYAQDAIPYGPATDEAAVVRIGRIPPPYAVTSTETGVVTLWDLQTGAALVTVDNGTGLPSVFGSINADATHLVWRDPLSEALYLLDFATGDNRKIADLDGAYVAWFFLSPAADVVLGVDVDFGGDVVAWEVASGERYDLGAYRTCDRAPDAARLSADGRTLVIGCNTGLDVWRVADD